MFDGASSCIAIKPLPILIFVVNNMRRIKTFLSDLHITIWSVEVSKSKYDHPFHTSYFFSKNVAYRCYKLMCRLFEHEYHVSVGGEPVFFFYFNEV